MLCCMHHCRDQLTHVITRATEALRALNVFHVCETDCDEVRWNLKSKVWSSCLNISSKLSILRLG